MIEKKNNIETLSPRERELTSIGAAIASNCVPCIEYHIPQARKVGLSDSQILEAVELADKVRRVPADKVMQTACALLEVKNSIERDTEGIACGCPDIEGNSEDDEPCGCEAPAVDRDQLENETAEDDNGTKNESRNDRGGDGCS